jgi:hypothetical protein
MRPTNDHFVVAATAAAASGLTAFAFALAAAMTLANLD